MPESEEHKTAEPPIIREVDGRLFLRLADDYAAEVVERLRETHADTLGRAYLLHLEPLATRLGHRWAGKRDLVLEHLKTIFERKFPEPNWCISLNGNSFLAVLLTLGEFKGALNAADLWYSACQFFVGDVSDVAPPLFEAIADDVDRIRVIPIDVNKYFDREEARAPRPRAAIAAGADSPDARRAPEAPGVMTTVRRVPSASGGAIRAGGWSLRVDSHVEPVFEMRNLALIGHRLDPVVVETDSNLLLDARAIAGMDWGDREQVDMANIEAGLTRLRQRRPDQRRIVLIVPAAFSTFASSRARPGLVTLVTTAARELGLKVIFEMRHLNGVPSGRVSEIAALLKPACMTVMGHVSAEARAIKALRDCNLAGVCLDFDRGQATDAALEAWLTPLAALARAATGACLIQGLGDPRQMAVARQAGASHATVRVSGRAIDGASTNPRS